MLNKPLVSVVLPTFNRKGLVERAIVSVLNQTYPNLELFVIDDGSNDGTSEALSCFRSDPRFHYAYQPNKGQSAARNRAIASASGDLVAFLDSDNYWKSDKLSLQLDFWTKKTGYDILYSLSCPVDLQGRVLKASSKVPRPSGRILDRLLMGNFITNNTALVARRCFEELGGFNQSLRIAEDYEMWLRFATRYAFLHHPEQVVYYCVEGERLSAREEQNIQVNVQILNGFFQQFPGRVSQRKQRMAFGNLLIWQIESRWNQGVRPSIQEVIRSITCNPLDQRTWRHLVKFFIDPFLPLARWQDHADR